MLKFLRSLTTPAPAIEPLPAEIPDVRRTIDEDEVVATTRAAAVAATTAIRTAFAEADAADARVLALETERTALGPAVIAGDRAARARSAAILVEIRDARSDATSIRDAVASCAEAQAKAAAVAFIDARSTTAQRVANAVEAGPLTAAKARVQQLAAALKEAQERHYVLARQIDEAIGHGMHTDDRPVLHGSPAEIRRAVLNPVPGQYFEHVGQVLADLAAFEQIAGPRAAKLGLKFEPRSGEFSISRNPWDATSPAFASAGEVCAASRERDRTRVMRSRGFSAQVVAARS